MFSRRFPEFHENDQGDDGDDGTDDTDEPGTVQVADEKLSDGEGGARNEAGGPDRDHAAPTGLHGDEPEGDDERYQAELSADHGAEVQHVEAGDLRQGDNRGAERAESHGGGVADQRKPGGFQRAKTQADEQGAGDGDRRAETGGAFNKRAEAEGDEQGLDPAIAGKAGHFMLEHGELPGLNGNAVDKEGVGDDPADGEQPEGTTINGRAKREFGGHVIDEDGDGESGDESRERGNVCADVPKGEESEQDNDGDDSNQRGEFHAA